MLKGDVELLVFKVLLCKDLLAQLVYNCEHGPEGHYSGKKAIVVNEVNVVRKEKRVFKVDTSDVLSILAAHLPIQLATLYGEEICFVRG